MSAAPALVAHDPFETLDVTEVGPELAHLHDLVVRNCGRIEVVGDHGASVVISKTELDSLERALAVLSRTDDVRELTYAVSNMAHEVASS